MLNVLSLWARVVVASAHAEVDEACDQLAKPASYDEQVQQDFLANYVALATSLSPIHGPIPHKAGRGAIGVDVAMIPPLGCGQRYVLEWTKTEDTNKSPVVPRPRITFAFQPVGQLVYPYAGVAILPGGEFFGTRNFLVSGEFGAGLYLGPRFQLGARVHGTLQRTLGDIATAYDEGEPAYADLYLASSVGADLHLGWELTGEGKGPTVTPYLALGVTDVTTFFWIGDDSVVPNNLHPYLGPSASVGLDALFFDRVRVAGEFYAAPGGHSLPDPNAATVTNGAFSRYGNLYTARVRLAYEL
ncbi:MAG: hypothetical protein Q8P41_06260 [Pseudomonadota bacterium]|nr:hypothetical protein [Pseudomonadota bacterium]